MEHTGAEVVKNIKKHPKLAMLFSQKKWTVKNISF